MDFSEALSLIKLTDERIARTGWNGQDMYVALEEASGNQLPYLYVKTAQGGFVPWLASQTDLLADDWEVYGVESEEADDYELPGVPVRNLKVNDLFEFACGEDEDGDFTPAKVYRVVAPHANLVKPETISRNTPFFMNQETGEVFQTHVEDRVHIVAA